MIKPIVLVAVSALLIITFAALSRKKNLLSFFEGGKWWLTWLSVAIITLMDELTSIFYAPAESYATLGLTAFVFIILASLVMRVLSNRMTEIAHILEHHNIKGGGVYSFSYLVLGPTVSFVAVASILVDYILTASISTVAAVNNGGSFFHLSTLTSYGLMLAIIWGICGLNIIGIKENARFTYGIFIGAAFVLCIMVASAFTDFAPGQGGLVIKGFVDTWHQVSDGSLLGGAGFIVFGISSVILAYSGIESVVQTAGLTKSWRDIHKAYLFLAITVGIFTPLISLLVLTRPDIDFMAHREDLLTYFASLLNGEWFGILVGALASFTLIMAVNTAFVASSELIERVAHRYGFGWIIKTNNRHSLYRIHILNAAFFTLIILITAGSQETLAHMYAVGLVASFTINMGSLVIYRYRLGSKEIREYFTSRTVTFALFLLLLACFGVIAYSHWMGLLLWLVAVGISLIIGMRVAKKRAPEIIEYHQTDNLFDLTIQCAETDGEFHIYLRRPKDISPISESRSAAYVTFYSPRAGAPEKLGPNHYRFPLKVGSLYAKLEAIISNLRYDFPDKQITFHFGWPTSSLIDRMSTGVMILSLLRLPKMFPEYNFSMEYHRGELPAKHDHD